MCDLVHNVEIIVNNHDLIFRIFYLCCYSPGRKHFNFSFILSLSKTVKPKVILVLSYIKEFIFFDTINTFNRVVFFDGPCLDKSILMYIMSFFGLFLFIYL